MANEILITDLVSQQAFQQVEALKEALNDTVAVYSKVASELAKGINFGVTDAKSLTQLKGEVAQMLQDVQSATAKLQQEQAKLEAQQKALAAAAATSASNLQTATRAAQAQGAAVVNTTNTISRALAEQEKVNALTREKFTLDKQALAIADKMLGSYQKNNQQLALVKAELKQASASMAEFNARLKAGDMSAEEYAAATADIIARQRELQIEQRELEKVLNNQQKTLRAEAGSYQELSLQLERMKMALKAISEEGLDTDQARAEADQLKSAIQDLDAHLKDMAADMGEFQRNVGNYAIAGQSATDATDAMAASIAEINKASADQQQGIVDAILGNSKLGQSLKGCITSGEGMKGMLSQAGTAVKAFGKTLTALLANPLFLAVAGVAGVAATFKWWYDYNKGLEEASRLTSQFTGLAGNEMKAVRNEVQAIADTFNLEFNETLQGANALAQGFGISYQEALKIMEDGLVSGVNANGEFLDTLKEYPRYFKEAGIDAEAFVAITAQSTKAGIFSDKGVDTIKEANLRLREMTTSTASALDGIGISSAKVMQELRDGTTTTWEVMQEVGRKLQELPASSAEVGTAIADIFGGPGEDAGLEYIKMLGDMSTSLDDIKSQHGEIATAQEMELDATKRLDNAMASLFDQTGGGFEMMKAQIFAIGKNALASVIEGCIGVANWFIRMYNNSMAFRAGVVAIGNSFNSLLTVVRAVFNSIVQQLKGIGEMLEGAFTLDAGKLKQGLSDFLSAPKGMVNAIKDGVVDGFKSGFNQVRSGHLNEIELIGTSTSTTSASGGRVSTAGAGRSTSGGSESASGGKSGSSKSTTKTEAVKDATEIAEAVTKAELDALKKRVESLTKGTQEWADAKREILTRSAEKEKLDAAKERDQLLKDLDASLKAGKVSEADAAKQRESITKSTADTITAIEEKLADDIKDIDKQVTEYQEKQAEERLKAVQTQASKEREQRDLAYQDKVAKLAQEQATAVKAAQERGQAVSEIEEEFRKKREALDDGYATDTLNAEIDALQESLDVAGITTEEREKLAAELAKKKIELAKTTAENEIEQVKKTADEDQKANEKRIASVEKWSKKAEEAMTQVSSLMNELWESEVSQLETQSEAEDERYDKQIEQIENLANTGAITEEEAEIRKRAAKAETEKKQEELEAKMNKIKYKQAVAEKANNIAQIAIATALGIMKASPNWVNMALVAAQGAIQTAIALAQPIKAYAKGTQGHPHEGGAAIVGDAGRAELVAVGGQWYVTPSVPTLVDLPKGAEVYPDASRYDIDAFRRATALPTAGRGRDGQPVIINDYATLEQRVLDNTRKMGKTVNDGILRITREMRRQSFDRYIARRT